MITHYILFYSQTSQGSVIKSSNYRGSNYGAIEICSNYRKFELGRVELGGGGGSRVFYCTTRMLLG